MPSSRKKSIAGVEDSSNNPKAAEIEASGLTSAALRVSEITALWRGRRSL